MRKPPRKGRIQERRTALISAAVTGHRDTRWRIKFNGLGDMHFCPVVRKTPALMALIEKAILVQAQAFAESVGQAMLERALNWAYLSETEGSFAIEGEAPSANKATLFAAMNNS